MFKNFIFFTVVLSACFSSQLSAEWLPRKIHEVRAFVYDYKQGDKGMNLVIAKNTRHPGVINQEGALLSKEQSRRLQKALVSKEKRKKGAFCYDPHHGFIFYDRFSRCLAKSEARSLSLNVDGSRIKKNPWFAAKTPNLKAILLPKSPADFRVRNLFVPTNALSRA